MTLREPLLVCRERRAKLAGDLDTRLVFLEAPPGTATPEVVDAIRHREPNSMLLACLVEPARNNSGRSSRRGHNDCHHHCRASFTGILPHTKTNSNLE